MTDYVLLTLNVSIVIIDMLGISGIGKPLVSRNIVSRQASPNKRGGKSFIAVPSTRSTVVKAGPTNKASKEISSLGKKFDMGYTVI